MVFSALNSVLNPLFSPLLNLNPTAAIIIITALIAFLMTVIYKYTTNQSLMKDLKNEIKEFQKEMKELRNDPHKMMEVQKKAMETNMKYMMHSFRSTIFTFIPIILIFSWLNANLAFMPIIPGEQFNTNIQFNENVYGAVSIDVPEGITLISDKEVNVDSQKTANWVLKGQEGEYVLDFKFGDKVYSKGVIITSLQKYDEPVKLVNDGNIESISIDNKKMTLIFGMGWFFSYIIFSIIFSMIFRKIMNVY